MEKTLAKNITIIGTGYVGLVTGACLAEIGHNVICVDKDQAKITVLKNGGIPIYEPGLKEVVERNVTANRLKFSTDLDLTNTDAIFLGVGTPTDAATGNADMTAFYAAANEVKSKLKTKALIVTKSTVSVGTGGKLKEIFGAKAEIVSNPEFLREGNAVGDFMKPDRIVIGSSSPNAAKIMEEIYAPLNARIVHTSVESSELIKYAANTFLAMKVAFINEVADICEAVGADVEDVATGIGLDPRIGEKFLKAGPGIGGSCFPKDIRALSAQERAAGLQNRLVEAVINSNNERKLRLAHRIAAIAKSGTICVLGLTFKANTDDMRESPALAIVETLHELNFKIRAYDPEGMREAAKLLPFVELYDSAEVAAEGASAIVILTEWAQFKKIDFSGFKVAKKVIIDMRNILNPDNLSGFEYHSIGRAPITSKKAAKTPLTA